jgi:hypothetical protein
LKNFLGSVANVKSDFITRTVVCPNERCGNTVYERTFDYIDGKFVAVWKCGNCMRVTKRTTHRRVTNRDRAMKAWSAIKAEWKPTDAALDAIVKAGAPSGCLLVYSSTWNHHLTKLLETEKPSHFDVSYHSAQARLDLEKARAFVTEKEKA